MRSAQKQNYLLPALILFSLTAYGQPMNSKMNQKNTIMSTTESNKEVVRKIYEEALNKRNMSLLQQLISSDYTDQRGEKGIGAFQASITALINGIPDIQWTLDELIAEGDKVTARWQVSGTHTSTFGSFTATGKKIYSEGMGIFELENNKVIKSHVLTDRVTFLQQIGILPADINTVSHKRATKESVYFIDKFLIPAAAKKEFYERMRINRRLIERLPGFIEDAAYEYTNNNGDLVCVTVAMWANQQALSKAKETVQSEYKKQGFDPAEMMKRLNISVDRGVYTAVFEQ
jgi:predicted ester cyclase